MTSNAGSQVIQKVTEQGGSEEDMNNAVDDALKARFLPEFLNRIDDVVVFRPLDRTQIRKIVTLQLAGLSLRLQQSGLSLEVTDAAIDQIADSGYDPTYGARPLKRVIQREIQNPLATSILKAQYDEGTTIRADFDGDRFTFTAT